MFRVAMVHVFLLIIAVNLIQCDDIIEDIIVNIPNGKLKGGRKSTPLGKTFYSYQQIPYAAPPVGDLRFKAPRPAEKWDGILDASIQSQIICHQILLHIPFESEDCLFLNVYTPSKPSEQNLLPVVVYIHGGYFIVGTGKYNWYGPEYLLDANDIIVVTINYRLGLFGFLSTEDNVIPGNNGLKDQQLAIKWVHDNIAYFGGDPNKVVLFGLSAGAKSVTYQLLNKKNEGLFRGAMSESGTFLSNTGFQRNARQRAFTIGKSLDGSIKNSNDSLALCKILMEAPTIKLVVAADKSDKKFSPGDIIKVPILMGIASEERLHDATIKFLLSLKSFYYDLHLEKLVVVNMPVTQPHELTKLGREIRDIYTNGEKLVSNLSALVRYNSDNQYTRSSIKFAGIYSQYSDVFFYEFAYDGKLGGSNVKLKGCGKVGHAEDSNYIWRTKTLILDNTDLNRYPLEDRITAYREQTIFSNFVKFLNPTPNKSELLQNLIWPKFDAENMKYVEIGKDLLIKDHPKKASYEGWAKIYNSLNYDDYDTY